MINELKHVPTNETLSSVSRNKGGLERMQWEAFSEEKLARQGSFMSERGPMRLSHKPQDESALKYFITSLQQNGPNGKPLLATKEPNSAGTIRNSATIEDRMARSQDGDKRLTFI